MSKARKGSNRREGWNASHQTRFSSDNQPRRRRGPSKIKIDRNLLRMFGDELNEIANVTSKSGDRLDMTNANFLVKSAVQKAMKGTLDDQIKFLDKLSRWGLLGQLDVEEALLDDLGAQLSEAKEDNKLLRQKHELAQGAANYYLNEALALLVSIDALLTACKVPLPDEVTSKRREIVDQRHSLEQHLRPRHSSSSQWTYGKSEEEWLEDFNADYAEDERRRQAKLDAFDQEQLREGNRRSNDWDGDHSVSDLPDDE